MGMYQTLSVKGSDRRVLVLMKGPVTVRFGMYRLDQTAVSKGGV